MPAGMHDGMGSGKSQQQSADDNRGHQTSFKKTYKQVNPAHSGNISDAGKQALENQRKAAVLSLSPSTSAGNKAVRYGLNYVLPGLGRMYRNYVDKNAMGYGNQIQKQKNRKKYEELRLLEEMNGRDNDQPYFLPEELINLNVLAEEDVNKNEEEKTFDYRFGDPNENVAEDVRLGRYRNFAANGGIMGLRARKAFGGIMDRVTGRRAYGLGSIFKKVTRAAKKVLSSDVGKMAIAGAGIYYAGGGKFSEMFSGDTGFDWTNLFDSNNKLLFSDNEFNPWKAAALTVGAGAAMGPAKVDQLPGSGNRGGSLIDPITGQPAKPAEMRASLNNALENAGGDPIRIKQINDAYAFLGPDERLGTYLPYRNYAVADGGRIGYDLGGPAEIGEKNISDVLARVKELEDEGLDFGAAMSQAMKELSEGKAQGGRIGAEEGGLMDLGGMEKDYRAEGGFVPIGAKEKADDVPARLSVNEFVFTADAVRNAGGGDIDQGAEVMENVMKNLEAGGKISAETQGNTGAQEMFSVSERLGEVI